MSDADGIPAEVIMRRVIYGIADDDGELGDIEAAVAAVERVEELETAVTELRGRVAELEEHRDAISDIGQEKTTKEEKIAAIVTWAQRQARDEQGESVLVKVKDIIGCTGVSRRYAYDLLDDLPERYDWLERRQDAPGYSGLESSTEHKVRGLVVDLEQLHTDEAAVNKFKTRTRGSGVQA